jgi:hypothetical protein
MINEYRVKKIALCNTPRIIFFPQKKKEKKKEKENEKENTATENRTGNGSKKKPAETKFTF